MESASARDRLRRVLVAPALVGAALAAAACAPAESAGGSTGAVDEGPPCVVTATLPSLGPGFTDITGPIATDIPAYQLPADTAPIVMWGAFTDTDGDGRKEILIQAESTPLVYRYDAASGLTRVDDQWMTERFVAAIDVNGDGRDDLIVPRAGSQLGYAVTYFDYSLGIALDPGTDVPPGLVAFDDLDGDGWLDVIASTGMCCAVCVDFRPIFRVGLRAFREVPGLVKREAQTNPASLLVARYGPGGVVGATIGNSCPGSGNAKGFYSIESTDEDGYPHFAPLDPMPADPHYMHDQEGVTLERQPMTYSAPMGGIAGDLDGDGVLDLVLDLYGHNFYRGTPTWPLEDKSIRAGLAVEYSGNEHTVMPWGIVLADVDQDGRPDVIIAHGNDLGNWRDDRYRDVPEFTTLHWNAGDFCFANITDQTHLDRKGQWQALTMDDLDGDGDADLIVGGQGEPPRVYRNDVESGNHGFSLRLKGTTSNHLALGAKVTVLANGVPDQHFIVSGTGSPSMAAVPPLFAGLGPNSAADQVRIEWPSGVVQELLGLEAGRLQEVTEPVLFTVEPLDRHVPADGKSAATLRITPRNPDGSIRTGAKITVAVAYGAKAKVSALTMDGDATVAKVVAPAKAGESVIEVSIDGAASGVRPRIWWTK